ncbi:MAG: hypothetical protein HFF02_03730 [Erysipelotrichaceae bacterium]|nr:hypothetical protein [Erysipelotrichaceae bacterium]
MHTSKKIHTMVLSALLIAVGIVIPMFMPLKLVIEPASFTLASHVPIIVSMFVSPIVAITVSIGTTIGFLMGGFPISVVLRAFSHVVWAGLGAWYLKQHPRTFKNWKTTFVFILAIGLLHAICEVLIITPLYISDALPYANYAKGFLYSIFTLVGIGTVVHSSIDFVLSIIVWKVLVKSGSVVSISSVQEI